MKILIAIFSQRLIISNVISGFLGHLKPKIFFVSQLWSPTKSLPPPSAPFLFQISGSAPDCFVSSKVLQPKIYLSSFCDLLLLLRTNHSVIMTSHQGKKKMTASYFFFIFTLRSTEKSEMLFYYISLYFIQ